MSTLKTKTKSQISVNLTHAHRLPKIVHFSFSFPGHIFKHRLLYLRNVKYHGLRNDNLMKQIKSRRKTMEVHLKV